MNFEYKKTLKVILFNDSKKYFLKNFKKHVCNFYFLEAIIIILLLSNSLRNISKLK